MTSKSNQNISFILKKYVSLLKGMNIQDPYFMKLIYSHLCKAVSAKKESTVMKISKQPWVEGEFVGPTVQTEISIL